MFRRGDTSAVQAVLYAIGCRMGVAVPLLLLWRCVYVKWDSDLHQPFTVACRGSRSRIEIPHTPVGSVCALCRRPLTVDLIWGVGVGIGSQGRSAIPQLT